MNKKDLFVNMIFLVLACFLSFLNQEQQFIYGVFLLLAWFIVSFCFLLEE